MKKISRITLKVIAIALTGLAAAALCALYAIDPERASGLDISFVDPSGDELVGNYYPGHVPRGVVILHGFSSDQVAMRNVASEMASMGMHVLTFDFSGHGRSPGTITLDNARLDRLARQVLAAKEQLKALAGLTDGDIAFVGHSMGARVAIEAETIDSSPVACIVAMGASINLLPNTQSEFFTGTSDADIAWIQGLNATNPPVDLLVVTGEWDDILTPAGASALISRLREGAFTGSPARDMVVIPATVHNYEVYSTGVIAAVKPWVAAQLGLPAGTDTSAGRTATRAAWWVVFAIAAFGSVFTGTKVLSKEDLVETSRPVMHDPRVQLVNQTRYATAKFLLWIPAAALGLVISAVFFVLPLGLPIFNLIYVALIGGYGVLLCLLYGRGKMPGTNGKLKTDIKREVMAAGWRGWSKSVAAMGLIVIACCMFYDTGLGGTLFINDRLAWLAIFSAFTTIGFFITPLEGEMLRRSPSRQGRPGLLLPLAGLFPFMLVAAFFGALGSTSGMVGALQGLAALAFVLACGPLVNVTSRSKLATAIFQAVLLQILVGSQGALFTLF